MASNYNLAKILAYTNYSMTVQPICAIMRAVWNITVLVGSDKCQTNHKVCRPLAETVKSL